MSFSALSFCLRDWRDSRFTPSAPGQPGFSRAVSIRLYPVRLKARRQPKRILFSLIQSMYNRIAYPRIKVKCIFTEDIAVYICFWFGTGERSTVAVKFVCLHKLFAGSLSYCFGVSKVERIKKRAHRKDAPVGCLLMKGNFDTGFPPIPVCCHRGRPLPADRWFRRPTAKSCRTG